MEIDRRSHVLLTAHIANPNRSSSTPFLCNCSRGKFKNKATHLNRTHHYISISFWNDWSCQRPFVLITRTLRWRKHSSWECAYKEDWKMERSAPFLCDQNVTAHVFYKVKCNFSIFPYITTNLVQNWIRAIKKGTFSGNWCPRMKQILFLAPLYVFIPWNVLFSLKNRLVSQIWCSDHLPSISLPNLSWNLLPPMFIV